MMRAIGSFTICMVLAACAPSSVGESAPGSVGASTPPSGERSIAAATQLPAGELVSGALGSDTVEGSCAYLEAADGIRYEVIWPDGWTLGRGLELSDPDGTIVARAGDEVTVRGSRASDMASTCQVGPIFRAIEVVAP